MYALTLLTVAFVSSCTTWAQPLVERALKVHPKVVILAVHATPAGSIENQIVASNIGRIGKRADTDDLHVIQTGKPKLEFNKIHTHYSVEEPLLNGDGAIIGALGVSFPAESDLSSDRATARDIQTFFAQHDPGRACAP